MPSKLVKEIEKHINKNVDSFIEKLVSNYNLDNKELHDLWNDSVNNKVKKTSTFQKFCKEQRPILKAKTPDLSFGDMNKELGKLWKGLSEEDKLKYN
tara:strand:- start:281 stop:571 length:291 start_codon:yes stop_codon:yes gene_type:complete